MHVHSKAVMVKKISYNKKKGKRKASENAAVDDQLQ